MLCVSQFFYPLKFSFSKLLFSSHFNPSTFLHRNFFLVFHRLISSQCASYIIILFPFFLLFPFIPLIHFCVSKSLTHTLTYIIYFDIHRSNFFLLIIIFVFFSVNNLMEMRDRARENKRYHDIFLAYFKNSMDFLFVALCSSFSSAFIFIFTISFVSSVHWEGMNDLIRISKKLIYVFDISERKEDFRIDFHLLLRSAVESQLGIRNK